MTTTDRVRPALDHTLDGLTLNERQDFLTFNTTPEVDSLGEMIARLFGAGRLDRAEAEALIERLAELRALNATEGDFGKATAAILDDMLRELHVKGARSTLDVLSIARQVREPLGVIAAHLAGKPVDTIAYFNASCAVNDVLRAMPALPSSLGKQLGPNRWALLERLAGERQAA